MESGSSINDIEDDDNEEFEKLSPGDISNILRFSADKKYKIQFLRSLVETKKINMQKMTYPLSINQMFLETIRTWIIQGTEDFPNLVELIE